MTTPEVVEQEPTPSTPSKQPEYGRVVFWWLMAALLVVVGILVTRKLMGIGMIRRPDLHGFVLEAPAPVGNFSLMSHDGEPVMLSDFRGQLVLVYFGYAACPDVCPTTMLELKNARAALKPAQQDDVQVLLITVDPERDSPELLKSYLSHFDPTFMGLTGTPDQIAAAAAPMGIYYERRDVDGASGYFMDHTASVIVLDRKGQMRAVWPFGLRSEEMAEDLSYFLRER